ncbi:hypothetical protein SAMN05421553_0200 [Pseudomonas anguilliseptica]|uniref:Uncharacterized protein n=1 Tax=Pseudomonas anguilliseptica TaxID=53406 RepID=A0A1H4P674_PSEAG|nr:hypothetical protein SAMN05421553_0200 [Pseudomonas anguilliseptica]
MIPLVPPYVSSELVAKLDVQLARLQCCAVHVVPGPALFGIGWDQVEMIPLKHPTLDTYLQAELLAARINALQGTTDSERTAILDRLKRCSE